MKTAWYLGHPADAVGDRALLIGDPDRVDRISGLLDDVTVLPVKRGLKTITGFYNGRKTTVCAFGMGAPIASIVMHELADLGVSYFLRIGTAMYFPPTEAGSFLLSDRAMSFEGTSRSYADDPFAYRADPQLTEACRRAVEAAGEPARIGLFASYDAFYRDMFGIDDAGRKRSVANREKLRALGVIAVDMETSALITVAGALGVAFTSLCLGTVDAVTLNKLPGERLAVGERKLFEAALQGISQADTNAETGEGA